MSEFEAPDVEVQALTDGMLPWKFSVTQGREGVTVHPAGRVVSDFREVSDIPLTVTIQIGLFEELLVGGRLTAGSKLPLTGAAAATSDNLPEDEAEILEWLHGRLEGTNPGPLQLQGFEYCVIASGGGAASSGRVGNLELRLQGGLAQLSLENLSQPSGFVYLLNSATVEVSVPLAEKVVGRRSSRVAEALPRPLRVRVYDPRIENKVPDSGMEVEETPGLDSPG